MNWWMVLAGLLSGGMLGGLLVGLEVNRRYRAQCQGLASTAAAAEALLAEVRRNEDRLRSECRELRERCQHTEHARVAAETQLAELSRHVQEQRRLLDEAKVSLSETFKVVAAEALAGNTAGFLALAEEKFNAIKQSTMLDWESRQQAIEALIQPLTVCLETYQQEAKQLEDRRLRELSVVGEQLRQVAAAQSMLQAETAKLVNALRSPHVRGRWGELTLRRTAELAGMAQYCDFYEQHHVSTDNGSFRPDMIVRLPAGREVVVDAKVPLTAYLEALDTTTEEERESALARHVALVRQHVHGLASKEYWEQFTASPEFVVLFIPNDSFLAAAAERDPSLVETALSKKVVIATPTTFIALLRAIAYGWRQEQMTESAQRISAIGQELSERLSVFVEHLMQIGSTLGKTVEAYNKAVGSLESRVLPSARKFKSLGIGGKREIDELRPIDQIPRPLTPPPPDDES
ncbi:MAG: DNA recombination protein RmuC [Nitrospirae bacterium]|nr:MAG: DNA recombination protein RmuC [Nitrospirota bacterium]